jgi:BRCT domain type II-containing protein
MLSSDSDEDNEDEGKVVTDVCNNASLLVDNNFNVIDRDNNTSFISPTISPIQPTTTTTTKTLRYQQPITPQSSNEQHRSLLLSSSSSTTTTTTTKASPSSSSHTSTQYIVAKLKLKRREYLKNGESYRAGAMSKAICKCCQWFLALFITFININNNQSNQ